jgi:hypothetical protein
LTAESGLVIVAPDQAAAIEKIVGVRWNDLIVERRDG